MSVQTHLTQTSSSLVLSSSEKDSISTSVTTLQKRLGEYFGGNLKGQLMFGSNTRGTILPRKVDSKSDVDYMLIFDNSENKKPQSFLDRLKKFTEAKYSTSERSQSYPTIVLSLNHIKFELVPAYLYSSYSSGYYIPEKGYQGDQWIFTDPSDLNQKLTRKNISHNYQIKPLVRLIKYWNAQNGYVYSSFKLEEYVINQYFYLKGLKEMLYSLVEGLQTGHLSQTSKTKVDRLKTVIQNTKNYENQGYPVSAETEIKKAIPPL